MYRETSINRKECIVSKKQKEKIIKDRLLECHEIDVPFNVYRFFNSSSKIYLMGNVAILSKDGDSGSLSELQEAIEWYVKQLGGSIKW
jgi:hypothetical protein